MCGKGDVVLNVLGLPYVAWDSANREKTITREGTKYKRWISFVIFWIHWGNFTYSIATDVQDQIYYCAPYHNTFGANISQAWE